MIYKKLTSNELEAVNEYKKELENATNYINVVENELCSCKWKLSNMGKQLCNLEKNLKAQEENISSMQQTKQVLIERCKELEGANRWRDCSNELPEGKQEVLVYLRNEKIPQKTMYVEYANDLDFGKGDEWEITHWKPIQEPKESEE